MVLVFDCGIVFLRSSYATPNGVVGGAGILPSSTDMEALTGFCGTGFGENRSSSMKEMSLSMSSALKPNFGRCKTSLYSEMISSFTSAFTVPENNALYTRAGGESEFLVK